MKTALLSSFAAISLLSSHLSAQIYTYNPDADPLGAQQWDNSPKWGLTSPDYPDEADITAIISRTTSAATIDLNGLSVTVGSLLIGGSGSGNGARTISNTGTINFVNSAGATISNTTGGTATIRANLQATGGLEFLGSNTILVINTSSRFGDIKLSGTGNVYLYGSAIISGKNVEMASTGSLRLGNGSNLANNTFNSNITLSGSGTRGVYSNVAAGERLVLTGNITGSGNLLLGEEFSNSTTELQGNNTYNGSTEIRTNVEFHSINNFGSGAITFATSARTLTYAAGNTADITQNSSNAVRAVALNVNTTINTGANDVTWENAVTGTSRLLKTGTGSLALLGDNSFNGATVSDGTLIAGHANALGGAGKDITVEDTGRLEVLEGVSVSSGNLTLESGAAFTFNLGATDIISLSLNGNQVGDGTFSVWVNEGTGFAGVGTYTLLSIDGTFEAGLNAFQLDNRSTAWGTLEWSDGKLIFNVVPEPTTFSFLLIAAGVLAALRRRRA